MTDVISPPGLPRTEPVPSRDKLERPALPLDATDLVPSPQKRVQPSTTAPGPRAKHPPGDVERGNASAVMHSGQSAAAASAANCRLLWRGKVVTEQGLSLYGKSLADRVVGALLGAHAVYLA